MLLVGFVGREEVVLDFDIVGGESLYAKISPQKK